MAEEDELFDITQSPSQTDRDLAAMLFAETAPPSAPQTEDAEPQTPPFPDSAPEKPGFLARLKGMFRRPTPTDSAPPALTPEEEFSEATEEAKPGFFTKLTRLFRRTPAETNPTAEEAFPAHEAEEVAETEPAEEEEAVEARPSPYKKILLIALLLLLVLGVGIGSAIFTFKSLQATKEAEYRKQEEALVRQQEALKQQQEEMAALKAQNEKLTHEAEAAKTAPPESTTDSAKTKPTPEAGDVDCAVVGKENAGETIKRCIEAYNRATGRTK